MSRTPQYPPALFRHFRQLNHRYFRLNRRFPLHSGVRSLTHRSVACRIIAPHIALCVGEPSFTELVAYPYEAVLICEGLRILNKSVNLTVFIEETKSELLRLVYAYTE